MDIKKNGAVYFIVVALAAFGLLGWSFALNNDTGANAQSATIVDSETLDSLYDAIFHRPVDADGKKFHLGRDLKDVLRDFKYSPELRYYGALFKAVKSYEEAQRAPGVLTDIEKQSYLNLIDSALSNLLAWVTTLSDQDACSATVGAIEARDAIQAAYDNMSPAAKTAAEKGVFNALKQLGKPRLLTVHPKCLETPTPIPSISPIPTPTVLPSPTVTPSISPLPSPTPTKIPLGIIKVLSPNGGEQWAIGSSQIIDWAFFGSATGSTLAEVPYVDIDLLSWSAPCVLQTYPPQPCPASVAPSFSTAIARKVPNPSSFSWVVGKNLSGNTVPAGSYIVRISNEDNSNQYDQSDAAFNIVKEQIGNLPPTISGISGPSVLKAGESGKWEVKASDPEQSRLVYSVIWGDETVVGIAERAVSSFVGGTTQTATFTHIYSETGLYVPTFTVTDIGGLSAKTSISVRVDGSTTVNNPPVIKDFPAIPKNVIAGQSVLFSWGVTDADGDNLSWSVSWGDGTGIAGACISPNIGYNENWTFAATHTWANSGTYTVKATVSDCRGGSDEHTFNITVQPKPTITVLEPNLGGYWQIGKPHLIKWTSSGLGSSNVNIFINRKALGSGGSAYIARNIPNSSNYAWDGKTIIPLPYSMTTLSPGNDYLIIIQNADNVAINDTSDELFNLTEGQAANATLKIVAMGPTIPTINKGQSLKLQAIYTHIATGDQIPVIVNWSWTANNKVSFPTGCENGSCYAQDLVVAGSESGTVTIKAFYVPPGGLDPLLAEIVVTVQP